jgi:hypothetical protein
MTEFFNGLGILTACSLVIVALTLLLGFVIDTYKKWSAYNGDAKWEKIADLYKIERDKAREDLETFKTKSGYR